MQLSDKGIIALCLHEGIVPAPYLDSVNVWTFGIGHTKSAGPPDPAKMLHGMPSNLDAALEEVFRLFLTDKAKYETAVNNAVKVPLKQHQFDALVSWHYNTGAVANATLVKELNKGNYEVAATKFMDWRKPSSIIGRRQEEQKLFRDGIYPSGKTVNVWKVSNAGRVIWTPVRKLTTTEVLDYINRQKTNTKPSTNTTAVTKPKPSFSEWLSNLFKGD